MWCGVNILWKKHNGLVARKLLYITKFVDEKHVCLYKKNTIHVQQNNTYQMIHLIHIDSLFFHFNYIHFVP